MDYYNFLIDEDIITTDKYLDFCLRNDICYIKTDYFYGGEFTWRGKIHPERVDKVCVIGHSDFSINDLIASQFEKVFCINRETDMSHVFGLPLGITNDCDDSSIHHIYGNTNIMMSVINEKINKENLAYMNFNLSTHPIRTSVWNHFSQFEWVKTGQIQSDLVGRKSFLSEIKSSKFVFCPRGNGIDTHRLWETLYMGSIPIVKYENTHHLFTDLPILFIDDWSKINKEYLEEKYNEFSSRDWNFEKLKISYWLEFIKKNI